MCTSNEHATVNVLQGIVLKGPEDRYLPLHVIGQSYIYICNQIFD